jgi:NAD(P)-dependent dehydrogenase (short-subunit alcohol dehydrogenase family)
MPHPLTGHVAIVAGATRGAGRGIARALGEAGAIVYCTGRSVRGQPSAYQRPETIEETAEMVTAAGGTGLAVRVDHSVEAEVSALVARVAREHKRLDVLVNSIAGEDPRFGQWASFWQTNFDNAAQVLQNALVSHLLTAKHAAPLMIKQRRGLIVEVTEGDTVFGGGGNALADVVKSALKGSAHRMAEEIRKHRVAVVAITPGYLRSESMLQHYGVTEENWRDGAKKDKNFLESETPLFIGRAVAALAADPDVMERSGDILSSWELGRHYGFTDADGRRPDWGRHAGKIFPSSPLAAGFRRYLALLERMTRRAQLYVGGTGDAPEPVKQRRAH